MKCEFLLVQMQQQFCLSLYLHPVTFVPDAYTHFGTLTIFCLFIFLVRVVMSRRANWQLSKSWKLLR